MMHEGRLRLVVADKHPAFAHGLSALAASVTSDLGVVGTVCETSALIEFLGSNAADVVVLDRELLGDDGEASLEVLSVAAPNVPVLLLYPREGAPGAKKALAAGVKGLLSKAASPAEIFSAVRAVAAGEVVMGASTAAALVSTADELSEQDVMLLKLFVAGLGQTDMARELLVSESTLKRRFLDVQRKLGASNRVEAVARAAREGWI